MADILGKDLDNVDDSLVVRQPFDIESSEISGPQFMTGSDFVRSAKIDSSWKEPIATLSQARSETGKGKQFVMSTAQSLSDTLANLPSNVANLYAQTRLVGHPILETLSRFADRSGWKEVKTALDNTIDLLNEREYPETKWAQRVIANTTNDVETRKMVRALYNQSQGIDSEKWYNQTGSIIGAMIPAMAVGNVAFSGARAFGAGRVAATRLASNITKGYIGAEMAGQYAEETASKYLERTGDKTFSNFTPKDATGLSALAYGAIGAQIEFMGGVEPIMAGALSKVGLKTGLLKAGIKIAGGEATEEFLQGITEGLMRKIDNTSDKTWGDVLKESLNSAMWGAFIGGMTGSTAFYTARRNLVKGIKTALPNISNEQAKLVADAMIDTTGEISSQDPTLRDNLRKKIDLMYKDTDIENKADRIDAMTDLEYSLVFMDANERGIDLAEHELFKGEVNELGWFRAGIPEERRVEIQEINDNIADLKTQLAELNKAKEKDWEKIEEIENKLAQANQYVLEKLSDMARDDGAAVRRILKGLEDRYVAKEKKKAGIPVDTLETTGKTYTDAEILGIFAKAKNNGDIELDNWENVRWSSLLSAGDTYQKGKRTKPATEADKAKFARKMLDKYMPGWDTVRTTPEQPLLQESFDIADENARLDDIYPEYKGETININGKERSVYNSNGDRIAKSEEALRNFYKWFGDSKVVDEQGRPLVVYHGSNMEFDTFDKNKGGFTTEAESALYGFYFTSSAGIAESYANIARPEKIKQLEKEYQRLEKIAQKTRKASDWDAYQKVYAQYEELELNYEPTEKIYNVYLKIENPMEYDFAGKHWEEGKYLEVLLEATNKNNDGVIFRNSIDDPVGTRISDIFVAFEPTQIKSVENRGTFSEKTGNIYLQNKVSGAAPSTYRGAYIPQYRFILRANRMDASTLSHEMAHDWFEVNFDRYRSGKASKEFMRAWGALEKALGVPENATETPRQASEAFARGYEAWIMQNQEWAKLINVEDKDKDAVEKLMKDYQNDLRDIYNDISNPYFKQTWGKLAELKPELKAWFDRVVNITDLDVLVERGEMTESQAQAEKLNRAIDTVIENTEDAETAQTLKEVRTLNDTSRYEVEGGNKNSLQERLSVLAKEIDENNMLVKGEKYDTRRDMMQVAEDADNFVKTRLDDALAIINGQMAEVEGLYREDIYTALERLAVENGDLNLLDELRNSEIANRLAKELGQRVAGFRNWKQSTDIDVVSALKSLDNKFNKALENKKAQKEFNTALSMLDAELKAQDTIADKELESTLKDLECQ